MELSSSSPVIFKTSSISDVNQYLQEIAKDPKGKNLQEIFDTAMEAITSDLIQPGIADPEMVKEVGQKSATMAAKARQLDVSVKDLKSIRRAANKIAKNTSGESKAAARDFLAVANDIQVILRARSEKHTGHSGILEPIKSAIDAFKQSQAVRNASKAIVSLRKKMPDTTDKLIGPLLEVAHSNLRNAIGKAAIASAKEEKDPRDFVARAAELDFSQPKQVKQFLAILSGDMPVILPGGESEKILEALKKCFVTTLDTKGQNTLDGDFKALKALFPSEGMRALPRIEAGLRRVAGELAVEAAVNKSLREYISVGKWLNSLFGDHNPTKQAQAKDKIQRNLKEFETLFDRLDKTRVDQLRRFNVAISKMAWYHVIDEVFWTLGTKAFINELKRNIADLAKTSGVPAKK